jgi:hypothetical protein
MNAGPLGKGSLPSIYGDLMRMDPKIEEMQPEWKLFSTIALNASRSSDTFLMLGPIQLVSLCSIGMIFIHT